MICPGDGIPSVDKRKLIIKLLKDMENRVEDAAHLVECFSSQLEALSSLPSIPQTGHGKSYLCSQHLRDGGKTRSFTVWFGYIVRRWSA